MANTKKTTTKGKLSPTTKRTTSRSVIVRTIHAGVHYGHLVEQSDDGTKVVLADSRRIFRWQIDHKRHGTSQVTCSELATFGPYADSRIAAMISSITIVGVIEVMEASQLAADAIEGWPL
jgi:hypothetical protein